MLLMITHLEALDIEFHGKTGDILDEIKALKK